MSVNGSTVSFTVSFGPGNEGTYTRPVGFTIRQLIDDVEIKSDLGHGANTKANIDNVTQPDATTIRDGDVVTLQSVANSKA